MEFPTLGKHCSKPYCHKLDFLPIKCDICSQIFCGEHYSYQAHNCAKSYIKDNQVPVCPLCNKPIPIPQGQQPDYVVGNHIDNDCQSDPAKNKRKVFNNKCSYKGCKVKEIVPVLCSDCNANFCLKHRHPQDHKCQLKTPNRRTLPNNMSEDEELARALALSVEDYVPKSSLGQEQIDAILARELQASEYQNAAAGGRSNSNSRNIRENCIVL